MRAAGIDGSRCVGRKRVVVVNDGRAVVAISRCRVRSGTVENISSENISTERTEAVGTAGIRARIEHAIAAAATLIGKLVGDGMVARCERYINRRGIGKTMGKSICADCITINIQRHAVIRG